MRERDGERVVSEVRERVCVFVCVCACDAECDGEVGRERECRENNQD